MLVFNYERMLENLGGDEALVAQLISIYFSEKEKFITKLVSAINERDYKQIKIAAHTLKGMLGNFFAQDAVKAAIVLEQTGHDEDIDKALIAFDQLKIEMEKLSLALKVQFDFIDIKHK